MKKFFHTNQQWLDVSAISLSVVCFLHCAVFPLLIAVLPLWGVQFIENELLHTVLLLLALPISVAGLWLGAQCHRHGWYMLIGFAGLMLMILGLTIPVEALELTFTVAGVSLVAVAHLLNWRSLRVTAS